MASPLAFISGPTFVSLEKKADKFFRIDQNGPGCPKKRREISKNEAAELIISFNGCKSGWRVEIPKIFSEALEARYPFQAVLGVLLEEV